MIKFRIAQPQPVSFRVCADAPVRLDTPPIQVVVAGLPAEYPGPYVVTPGNAAQTLPTAELLTTQNIIINPIPSNYGRILWDGTTMTII